MKTDRSLMVRVVFELADLVRSEDVYRVNGFVDTAKLKNQLMHRRSLAGLLRKYPDVPPAFYSAAYEFEFLSPEEREPLIEEAIAAWHPPALRPHTCV
jgi:hypothetical protein